MVFFFYYYYFALDKDKSVEAKNSTKLGMESGDTRPAQGMCVRVRCF